jgi:hypothetical protein
MLKLGIKDIKVIKLCTLDPPRNVMVCMFSMLIHITSKTKHNSNHQTNKWLHVPPWKKHEIFPK